MRKYKFNKKYIRYTQLGLLVSLTFISTEFMAANSIGGMASNIVGSFAQLARLITAGSYLAGLGFSIGAILKFKAHKDTPTQVTIGAPIALTFVAAALLFLPSILEMTGFTMFGTAGKTAGPTGVIFQSQ